MLPRKAREILIGKRFGQLDFTLAAPTAKDDGISVLYLTDGVAVLVHQRHGRH